MSRPTTDRTSDSRRDDSTALRLAGVALGLLGVGYTIVSLRYGLGLGDGVVEAGVTPFALGVLLTVMSIVLVIAPGKPVASTVEPRERRRQAVEAWRLLASLAGYAAIVTLIGFAIGTALGVPLVLRYVFRYAWPRAVVAGLVMAGIGYVLFEIVLRVQLP